MYDKIAMWIRREYFDIADYCKIECLLSNVHRDEAKNTNDVMLKGGYNGLKVQVSETGAFITGSLSAYYHPSNCFTLTRASTKEAIQSICDAFKFHAEDAKVSTLEFGTIFPMREAVYKYIKMLGEMPRMERIMFPKMETLYYTKAKNFKVLRFYDKGKEAIKKDYQIPKGLEDANLLRYEVALNKRIKKQLKVGQITASTLYDKEFYLLMKRFYRENYKSINKNIESMINKKGVTAGEAKKLYYAYKVQTSNESIDEIISMFDFANRIEKSKFRKSIEEEQTKNIGKITNEALINELDDCILNIEDYP